MKKSKKNITKKANKMVEEITEKRKLTSDLKHKVAKKILKNIWIAILIVVYFCAINLVASYASNEVLLVVLKILAMTSILIDVLIFELSYRKDSVVLWITGTEWLIVSIIILYMPQVYGHIDKLISRGFMLVPVFFAVYYFGKSIFIYIKTLKQYQNNLSDVKEIVKEEN